MEDIFSSLKSLGFNYEDDLEIYLKKEDKCDEGEVSKSEIKFDVNTLLYDKKIDCPVCLRTFSSRVVKAYVLKVKHVDTDGFKIYDGINPYFYDVLVCQICGYSALKSDFLKLPNYKRETILVKVSNKWTGKEYPQVYDCEIAIERYKLALLNAVVGELKDSTKAVLCLKIAWMYRSLEKQEEEKVFLQKALQGFLIAYENERTPIYGLNIYSLKYLIGEIYRRIGDSQNAKIWFGKVILSNAGNKLKEKARDMRELVKEATLVK
ncbi:MAG: DUF2225 domain-containing protein [Clostridium sp.]|uniref:DUF2225 domain-containing protein n=1 Tax=Clostridium sp. TaxID=1506 RepID=UPI00305E52D4